ncbi:MAG: ACP S-malonyltransferase [Anaerolineae bacterium]|nr:ACP S-malonyltransferase [Anaerolineae bacterium]
MSEVAFLFPGQGSQTVGMGRDLAAQHPAAAAVFAETDGVLGFPLSRLCFEGPAEVLTDTINAQPAILAASIAALRAWEAMGNVPQPRFVAGHSMGEYSALCAAGALSLADGLRLVRERGRLMKRAGEAQPGGMAAVLGLERTLLEAACAQASQETGRVVQVANDNAPGQIVISGDRTALERAGELAKAAGAKRVIPLAVSIAAHSPLMQSALDDFRRGVEATPMQLPTIPVVSNVRACPLDGVAAIREELVLQLISPVRWTESVGRMASQGVATFVEVGPGTVLTGLVKRIAPAARTANVGDAASIAAVKTELA